MTRGTNPAGSGAVLVPAGSDRVYLTYSGSDAGAWISTTNPLIVTITGYASSSASSPQSATVMFTSNFANALTIQFFYITDIKLSRAIPGPLAVNVVANSILNKTNTVLLGSLVNTGTAGSILYALPGKPYTMLTTATAVTYNSQNGQPSSAFTLAGTFSKTSAASPQQYYTYTMNEVAVPANTAALDSIAFGIVNSTGGVAVSPMFQLNYSASFGSNNIGTHANTTYIPSSGGAVLNAQAGFRTERGSKVSSIAPSSVTVDWAKLADTLRFVVSSP